MNFLVSATSWEVSSHPKNLRRCVLFLFTKENSSSASFTDGRQRVMSWSTLIENSEAILFDIENPSLLVTFFHMSFLAAHSPSVLREKWIGRQLSMIQLCSVIPIRQQIAQ